MHVMVMTTCVLCRNVIDTVNRYCYDVTLLTESIGNAYWTKVFDTANTYLT